MKILFLSAQYPPEAKGGGELSTHITAQGLIQLGHTVHVVTSGNNQDTYTLDGVFVTSLPLGLRGKPLFEKHASRRALRILVSHIQDLSSYDIIHAHDFRSALMIAGLSHPLKVVTARDYAQISGCTNDIQADGSISPGCHERELITCHRIAEASFPRKLFRMWQYGYNIGFRKAAFASFPHQIFISNSQKAIIEQVNHVSSQHTAVIYNPISPEYLSEPLRRGKQDNVLYAGRVEMYKGVLLLLKAWKQIMHHDQVSQLTIAGDGAQREEYERLAATWGMQYRVKFIQHVPYHRLKGMINDCEVFVAPHLWVEPFGRTVIEGMSRGKVVVSANVGGPSEIITHEKTGLLFERGSVESLAHELTKALTMNHFDKQEMGIAARDYVRDHFSLEQISKEYELFYTENIEKSPRLSSVLL